MYDPDILLRTIRSLTYKLKRNKKENLDVLSTEEINDIKLYLKSPTENGIWKMQAKWNPKDSICYRISEKIQEVTNEESSIKSPEYFLKMLDEINKFSFLLSLFFYIKSKEDKSFEDEFKNDFLFENQDLESMFKLINIDKIVEEYKEAYVFFVDNLYFKDMTTSITLRTLFKFSKGYVIIDNMSDIISIQTLNHDSLQIAINFLKKTGMIMEVKIERIFSPEELLFDPYIIYLKNIYKSIIEYEALQKLIQKAISEFEDNDYPICIGTIGILCEDVLTQIYETLFREEADRNQTLGQRYDGINSKTKGIFSDNENIKRVDFSQLFVEANILIGKASASTTSMASEIFNNKIQMETLELMRKMIQIIKDQDIYVENTIKKAFHKETNISIFPKKIQADFIELLRYRNATSHKSRIPLGSYEAIRSVYCALALILWWNDEKSRFCWTDSKEEIIENIIRENKGLSKT